MRCKVCPWVEIRCRLIHEPRLQQPSLHPHPRNSTSSKSIALVTTWQFYVVTSTCNAVQLCSACLQLEIRGIVQRIRHGYHHHHSHVPSCRLRYFQVMTTPLQLAWAAAAGRPVFEHMTQRVVAQLQWQSSSPLSCARACIFMRRENIEHTSHRHNGSGCHEMSACIDALVWAGLLSLLSVQQSALHACSMSRKFRLLSQK
jgi:hypothetical protein